jgi:hypothetical protein
MTPNPLPGSPLAAPSDSAAALVRALAQRGITFICRGEQLKLKPTRLYKTLSDDELSVLRHCREEIKAIVRNGLLPVVACQTAAPTPVAERPKPEISEHVRRIIFWDSPEERARRNAEATAVMMRQLGKPSPYL